MATASNSVPINDCIEPSGYIDNTDDCDDGEPLAWNGALEVCDGVTTTVMEAAMTACPCSTTMWAPRGMVTEMRMRHLLKPAVHPIKLSTAMMW